MKVSEFVQKDEVAGQRLLSGAMLLPEFKDGDPKDVLDQDAMGIIEKLEKKKILGFEQTTEDLRAKLLSCISE